MKKILIFLLLFLFLFTVSCSWLKKDLTLEPRISAQEKRIKELERELGCLKWNYNFQTEIQAQELEQIKKFIQLLKAQQSEFSKKDICPFIPEEVTFCGEKVPLDRFGVRERLEWALMREMDRWAMALIFLRSGRWFPMIEQKREERKLPEDLKYLAAIESDLNIEAESNAGAGGLWQFMEDTARDLCDLRVDLYIDERFDPEKSTEAALEHLKELYQELGRWTDALAGYNMNKDRYKEQKAKEQARDFYEIKDIPDQTRKYVFRAIAVKLIMENPEKYGYPSLEEINRIKYEPYPVEVRVITITSRRERIVDIAQRIGMTYQEFRIFNPHVLIKIKKVKGVYKVVRDWLPKNKYKVYIKIRTQ